MSVQRGDSCAVASFDEMLRNSNVPLPSSLQFFTPISSKLKVVLEAFVHLLVELSSLSSLSI